MRFLDYDCSVTRLFLVSNQALKLALIVFNLLTVVEIKKQKSKAINLSLEQHCFKKKLNYCCKVHGRHALPRPLSNAHGNYLFL